MVRICIPTRLMKLSQVKNHTYIFEGLQSTIDYAKLVIQASEPTSVTIGKSKKHCLQALETNISDVSYGLYDISHSSYYHVPIVQETSSLVMMTGYEVNEYINSQTNKSSSEYGILVNLGCYNASIYITIAIFIATFFILNRASGFKLLKARNRKFNRRKKSITIKWRKKNSRMIIFLSTVSLFLFVTPFLCLFQASRVVTVKPQIIDNYETLMKSNVSIFALFSINGEAYIKPSSLNILKNDVVARFYKFFKSIVVSRELSSENPYLKSNCQPNEHIQFCMTRLLVHQKLIILTHRSVAETHVKIDCMLSSDEEFYRIFVVRDESQREILCGNAFNDEFNDIKLIRRLSNLFEFGCVYPYGQNHIYYMDQILKESHSKNEEHSRLQREYCMDEKLEPYMRETTWASNVDFFASFWFLLFENLIICVLILLLERSKYYSMLRDRFRELFKICKLLLLMKKILLLRTRINEKLKNRKKLKVNDAK